MREVRALRAARVDRHPGDDEAHALGRHVHPVLDPRLVQRMDELDFAVRVHLVHERREQALHQVAVAQPLPVGPILERLRGGDAVRFQQPRVVAADRRRHVVEQVGVQRAAERAEILVGDALQARAYVVEPRRGGRARIGACEQRHAVREARHARRRIVGLRPAREEHAQRFLRRLAGRERVERVLDLRERRRFRVERVGECALQRAGRHPFKHGVDDVEKMIGRGGDRVHARFLSVDHRCGSGRPSAMS
ncbi:Uncharacterised protein [Burkholderia pseudomallei]|nr:Uncharacterised protein [Burkholderia pseudomallei]